MASGEVVTSQLSLPLIARGKVRDVYDAGTVESVPAVLFVATDRISAFDIILANVSGPLASL